ncbi:MAG: AI-2E family transporter [bacterium]|nr:AI-2E family transporter [bacterium]
MNEKILDISWRTIFKLAVAVSVVYLFYSVRQILIWFVFAITIYLLFDPAIAFLQRKRVPRALAVLGIYISFFGLLGILIYMMVPIFITEIQRFLDYFPEYFEQISPWLKGLGFETFQNLETFLKTFEEVLQGVSKNVFSAVSALFGGIFATVFVLVLAIFLSLEEKAVEKALILLFPKNYESKVLEVWGKCQNKVSGWFAGRLIGCIFVGVASYIAFLIFNVRYPFTLALFSGVFNFVPYVGPIGTGIILFLIVFPASAIKGILVVATLIVIQEIENNILSPILMKKFVGLPPVLVLLSLVIGAQLWGFLGAILAIPLFGILFEFLKGFLQKRKEKESAVTV